MSFKILTDNPSRIFVHSNVRAATDRSSSNLRVDLFDGEKATTDVVKYYVKEDDSMMITSSEDMVGHTFLAAPLDDGQRHRTRILRVVDDNT